MADVKFLVYFTCFCLYQDLVFCDKYGESGNKIKLNPVIRGKPEEILWTHNGNKVLEYDGKQMDTYGSFKDRVELDFETGQLTIRKLNNQDSGTYQSEIVISKKVYTSSHILTVLDALPEPLVTCEVNETSNVKKLFCSVESQTEPSYEWSGSDVKQPGPTLVVNEPEENLNSVYTCTVKNKAGSRTTDFNLQDCTTGRAKSAVLVPVLIVILLLIILLAALAFYFYRHKRQLLHAREVRKSGLDTVELEKGEHISLLGDESTEAMPASSQATLPCRNRLTAPNKKLDQDSELKNGDENHEGQKLLKESPQSAITGKNKDDTGNTNGDLDKNKENSGKADGAEENANSKAEKTDSEVEIQKFLETQEEKEKSQVLKNKSENEEKTPEESTEKLEEQENKNADNNKSEDEENKPGEPTEKPGDQGNKNEREDEGNKHGEPATKPGDQGNKNESEKNTVVSEDVGDGLADLPALGSQFCQWFFTLLNSQNPTQGQPAQDWCPQHFWPDVRLRLLSSTGERRVDEFNGAELVSQRLHAFTGQGGLFFSPNLEGQGLKCISSAHGLVLVAIAGTVHRDNACLGIFEKVFGLIRSPMDNNHWKIKFVNMKVEAQSAITDRQLPVITYDSKELLSLCD